jgi:uncharacterized protein (DUF433 family)
MVLRIEPQQVRIALGDDGIARVAETRVTLDSILDSYFNGASAETIAGQFPSVPLADVYGVIGYYLAHRSEVDAYLDERDKLKATVRAEAERKHSPAGVRDRLLARRGKPC